MIIVHKPRRSRKLLIVGGLGLIVIAVLFWWFFFYSHAIDFKTWYIKKGDDHNIQITQFRGPRGARANNIIPGRYSIKGVSGSERAVQLQFGVAGKVISLDPPFDKPNIALEKNKPFSLTFHVSSIEEFSGTTSNMTYSINSLGTLGISKTSQASGVPAANGCFILSFFDSGYNYRSNTVIVLEHGY